MRRRELLGSMALSGVGAGLRAAQSPWPFDGVPAAEWTQFRAAGFADPVCGLVFHGAELESGVPLGGLSTGYMTLEGSGKIGFHSIFNDLAPPKKYFADWLTIGNVPLSTAHIVYWGHYPVADLKAHFDDLPLEVAIRAFTPFIPGDAAVSNTPAALFEIELRNTSGRMLNARVDLQFPPPPQAAALAVRGENIVARDAAQGLYGSQIAVPANGSARLRFAVGWYLPIWKDSGSEYHRHRYFQRFRDAADVAEFALRRRDELLRRICAWQAAVYAADLPVWLRDALVQTPYSLAKNSVWIARTRKDEWWGEDGWFTHSESHVATPIVETMVCRMHGHFPLLFFFPELEATTLDAFRHFQIGGGEIPFCFGQPTSMRDPRYHCQHPLNSGQYAQMVLQLYRRTGDRTQLAKFYHSARRAIRYQYSLDDDGCGLVHDQSHAVPPGYWPANQFYDIWPWQGTSAYVAGTWLATLACGKALALEMRDAAFAAECEERLAKARQAYERLLWNGAYYRLWNDAAAGKQSDVVLANQLMAEWCTRVAGLGGVLPAGHVRTALDTIEKLNLGATSHGLINGVTPDGKPFDAIHKAWDHSKNIFVGENLCAAMTFLYHGRRGAGVEIARRLVEAMSLRARAPWNQRCLLYGETGLPCWGDDYYSNMALWAFPMALAGESIESFTHSGLAARVIRAGAA
ncbi:MAG: GH116 family glycosyl hydrolase [Bryobacteraceae bacterium]